MSAPSIAPDGISFGRRAALRLAAAAALVGLAVSLELVRHHMNLGNPEFGSVCAVSARVDCSTVLRTRYAKVFGVPIAVWGAATYLGLAAAAFSALRRPALADRLSAGILGVGLGSLGYSAWLFYVSHWRLHVTCLLCHALYFVAVAVAVAGAWAVREGTRSLLALAGEEWERVRSAPLRAAASAVALLLSVVALFWMEADRRERFVRTSIYGEVARGTWPRIDPALLPVEGHPSTGPADAPVVIVEFADFECLFCGESRFILEDIVRSYPVRLVFVPFPGGPCEGPEARAWACLGSAGAKVAHRLGRFWEYHEAAFSNPPAFRTAEGRRAIEEEVGLPLGTLDGLMAEYGSETGPWGEVRRDVETAAGAGVAGTPAFFINGMGIRGYQPAWFWDLVVRGELERAGR